MLSPSQTPSPRAPLRRTSVCCAAATCLFLCLTLPTPTHAQYRYHSLTTDDGLPVNTVSAILQTRDGYLWITTSDGLARYNGATFTVFNKSNTPNIKGNRFTVLFEDHQGTLWIGTAEAGILRYRNGVFQSFDGANGLPGNAVADIKEDLAGDLMVLTTRGVARLKDDRFTVYTPYDESTEHTGLRIDRSGGVWLSDVRGLHRYAPDGSVITYRVPGIQTSIEMVALFDDRRGTYWIGAAAVGLIKIDAEGLTVYDKKDGLPEKNIANIDEDRAGDLWVALRQGGVCRLHEGRITSYTTSQGLPTDRISFVYQDREGSHWLGTVDKGLIRITENLITMYSGLAGLSSDNVYPIYEDRAGDVWVGAWYGLAKLVNGKPTDHALKQSLSRTNVTSIFEASDASLWIGTFGSGVQKLSQGKVISYTKQDGLSGDNVWCIQQDHNGTIWIGASNGLNRFLAGSFSIFRVQDGLSGNDVKVIIEGRDGSLWIGTYGGLTRLKDGVFTIYTEKDGIGSNQVRALYEDRDGVLWIGTYDGGLSRFADGKFTKYSTKEGLFDYGVFQILEDDRGNFWISCNRGIYRVRKQELNEFAAGKRTSITSVAYGRDDGLLNLECNGGSQPAGWKTRDGRLWFPTQAGVAVIDPNQVSVNSLPPPVVIEGAVLNGQSLSTRNSVEIPAGNFNFEISYSGLSFIKSEQMRFKYKLEGLDPEWVDAGNRRAAYFSYIPPGEYTFRVIAANSDGVWNNEGASMLVRIRPPFWRTWWFMSLAGALFVGLLVLVYSRRISTLKKAQATQEAFSRQLIASQEQERKRIAGELHDSLGQNLLIIKNQALLGRNFSTESEPASKRFEEISTTTSQAIEEVRAIAYALRPFQLDRLGLTKAIKAMVDTVAESSGIDFGVDVDNIDDVFSQEAEINVYRIIQEAINNIVKHSSATKASVEVKREKLNIHITVKDNGTGFGSADREAQKTRGGGLGLAGISERVKILRGRHTIQTGSGEGSTHSIMINIKDAPDGA